MDTTVEVNAKKLFEKYTHFQLKRYYIHSECKQSWKAGEKQIMDRALELHRKFISDKLKNHLK